MSNSAVLILKNEEPLWAFPEKELYPHAEGINFSKVDPFYAFSTYYFTMTP